MTEYMGSDREWYVARDAETESSRDGNVCVQRGPIERDHYRHGPFGTREEAVVAAHAHAHDSHQRGKRWNGWGWEPCSLGAACPSAKEAAP